ncbi:MAG: serine--tRNA ligase [Verrucomicrobiales bacterium]|nr:serine--tRNA ligase [Verrucomicrobiales bacterium]|tara:strand:+ start:10464 stop:11735 length:1272 start_codon:yes stop_codon:yes gene_type:complete
MLDIRTLREDSDSVKARIKARGGDPWSLIDEILECDEKRRSGETEKQQLQGDRNRISKEIGILKREGKDSSDIEAKVRAISERIKTIGEEADAAEERQTELLLQIPNLPHEACPVGEDESANPEVRTWGEKPTFDFEPKDHVQLGEDLNLFSFELATKISSSGFITFTGAGAKLQRALIQFLLDLQTKEHGYTEVAPPCIINRDAMFGTGQLPKFEFDMYGLEDNAFFLAPTAEVPVTNLYREEILKQDRLPIKLTAHTPCFRREAGSAGRESRGMIRMHQFDKVELVNIAHPDESFEMLETLTKEAETVLQKLGLHYRTIELCTGDLGFSSAKTYDIEVWAPGHGGYLEVSSCSNFVDYQARRMRLRFKDSEGKNRFCHTLNGSGTALPRLYVALIETYQQVDGSILVPEALRPYIGSDHIS